MCGMVGEFTFNHSCALVEAVYSMIYMANAKNNVRLL